MNTKILVAAAVAVSLAAVGAADAKNKHKRYRAYHGVPYAYVPVSPHYARTPGPPWAQPWECYTDEGYGRYRPCNSGRGR
jgi:hypothetical protein